MNTLDKIIMLLDIWFNKIDDIEEWHREEHQSNVTSG